MGVLESSFTLAHPYRLVRRQEQRYLVAALLLTDALMVGISFALAYLVRFVLDLPLFDDGTSKPLFYVVIVIALVPGYLALFHIHGLYNRANLLGGTTEYARMSNAVTIGLVLVIFVNFIQPDFVVARAWLLLAWVLMVVLCISSRFLMRRLVYWLRHRGHFLDRTLVVGANPEGIAVTQQLIEGRSSGAQIIGFIDDYLPVGHEPLPGVAVLGGSSAFASLVELRAIVSAAWPA
jgi:FlaA1/EpsC-like NDP-sugar epimerase